MGYFVFVVCILFFIHSLKHNSKKIITPQTLFYLLWSFILFLSLLNLYNIIRPSSEAYFLILLMLLFFFIGDCIVENKNRTLKKFFVYMSKIKTKIKEKIKIPSLVKNIKIKFENVLTGKNNILKKINNRYNLNYKYIIIYVLCALVIIFTLIDCFIVFKGLKDGIPMYKIRHWRMGAYGIDNNPMLARRTFLEEIFRSVVLNPFETILPPIAAYSFFNRKESRKNKIALVSLSAIIIILSSIAGGGGRLSYIYYFGCFLLAFLVFVKNNKNVDIKKYLKYILLILVFGLVVTILLTKIRTTNSFIKQLYTYFAMPPTLLTIWLPKIKNVEHTFGLLTTFGFHSYIFRGLDAIGLDFLIPNIYNATFEHLLNAEQFMQLGFGVGNAFVTPIYYFMIDGGIPFVCIASLVFGIGTKKIYNYTTKKMNMKKFVVYVLTMYGIFLTFMRIQTAIPAYILSFVFAFLILNDKKKHTKK